MKDPTLPIRALALFILFSGAVLLPFGENASGEKYLIEPEERGIEALLNGPGHSFDLSVLDPLIEEGSVIVPEEPQPEIHEGEAIFSHENDIFLIRSRFDPDLGVVVRKEYLPNILQMQDNEWLDEGLSISIVIPGVNVETERNMTSNYLNFNYTGPAIETLNERIVDLDFTDIRMYNDQDSIWLDFRYGNAEITLSIMNDTDDPGRTAWVSIDVKFLQGSLTDDLRARVLYLLDLFGGQPEFWDASQRSDFQETKYLIEVETEVELEDIDWETTMRTQLLYFGEIGLISGLSREDIDSISSKCEIGTYGVENRLIYDQRSMDWNRYSDSNLPPYLEYGMGPPNIFDISDFPPQYVPRSDGPEKGPSVFAITLLVIGAIFLLIGSLLFQRINRAVKINSVRRKMLFERIRQMPGIHFSALMKDLDLKPGVASYHINRLEKAELIKSYQDGMYRRFYLYEERVEMKLMLSDLQKIIVNTIDETPGISQMDISRMVGKSKVVINYHVRFLRDLGLLVLERDGRETHCFLTPQGARMSRA